MSRTYLESISLLNDQLSQWAPEMNLQLMYFDRDFKGANRENERRKNLTICTGLS